MSSHHHQNLSRQSRHAVVVVTGSTRNRNSRSTRNIRQTPHPLTRNKAVCRFLCAGLFIIPGICLLAVGAIQFDGSNVVSITFVVFGAIFINIAIIALIQTCTEFRNQHRTQNDNGVRARSSSNRNDDHESGHQVNVAYINYPLPELADGSALPSYESVTKESAPPSYEEAIHDTDEPSN
ncbi:unnamed protein product [Clavelina lepadiformis]|uniref:Uncharacterized protein n=1 Tax=Clavelina lepadiformis TaxID=159417 RepID=A0ABP0GUP7_CLALP